MKRTEREKLLNEILSGEELADFRQASLAHALASLERRRQRRRALRVCAWASLPVLLAAALLINRPHATPLTLAVSPETATPRPPVKFINDDELMALFPNRALALIGAPGHQQLVFLDEPTPGSSAPSEGMN